MRAQIAMEILKMDTRLKGVDDEINSKSLDELITINNALNKKSKSRRD